MREAFERPSEGRQGPDQLTLVVWERVNANALQTEAVCVCVCLEIINRQTVFLFGNFPSNGGYLFIHTTNREKSFKSVFSNYFTIFYIVNLMRV